MSHSTHVHFLRTTIPWFGSHFGYDIVSDLYQAKHPASCFQPVQSLPSRLRGRVISMWHGLGRGPQAFIDAAARFGSAIRADAASVGHVLHGEEILPYLKLFPEPVLEKLVITIHQLASQWRIDLLEALSKVKNVISLFSPSSEFTKHLPHGFHQTLLGVDLDHFHPQEHNGSRRILYSGVHLRDVDMFERVATRLLQAHEDLNIDLLVPEHRRNLAPLLRVAAHPRVHWLARLDDDALARLYQTSDLTLLPMQDSGANTAVIEALASGLPVVTTDVGGIRDYGGGSTFPVLASGDDDGMVALASRILSDHEYRRELGRSCRRFAELHLSWASTIDAHRELYLRVAQSVR